jgi:hypothetical protein
MTVIDGAIPEQILMHHIRTTLPDIKAKIQSNLLRYQTELTSLGGAAGEANSVRRSLLLLSPSNLSSY